MVTIANAEEQKNKLGEDTPTPDNAKESRVLSYIIGGVIAFIIFGSLLLFLFLWITSGSKGSTPKYEVGSVTFTGTPVTVGTVSHASSTFPIEIINIGYVEKGEYKGKGLVVALAHTPQAVDSGSDIYSYAYYISDSNGSALAWDPNYVHHLDVYSAGGAGIDVDLVSALHFDESHKKDLSFLPAEFSLSKTIELSNGKTLFSIAEDALVKSDTSMEVIASSVTKAGSQVVKKVDVDPKTGKTLPTTTYYLALPFGRALHVLPAVDFVDSNQTVPHLTWITGDKTVETYQYGQYVPGWDDCYKEISISEFYKGLMITGKTVHNDAVYEIDATKFPEVYQCLKKLSGSTTVSNLYFADSHPMFFWKHAVGDFVAFVKTQ